MDPVRTITGTAVPLRRSDVDTDQIIPAEWLKRVERTGFGEGLFDSWRKDPTFALNQPEYREAVILVAGPNFGTGSSREHAVWALMDRGFRAVISPRFGDIFRNNSTKSGLVPAAIDEALVLRLQDAIEADPDLEVTVDVETGRVYVPAIDLDAPFPIDEDTRHRLLEGLDDIGITMGYAAEITAFESRRAGWMPTTA